MAKRKKVKKAEKPVKMKRAYKKRVYKKRKQAVLADPKPVDINASRAAVAAESDRIPDEGAFDRGYNKGLHTPLPYGIDEADRNYNIATERLAFIKREAYRLHIDLLSADADVEKAKLVLEARTKGIPIGNDH